MNYLKPRFVTRLALVLLILLLAAPPAGLSAQTTATRERLLNGLSFFVVPRPGSSEVSLHLRVHSGAAFDLAGKEGTSAILAASLFPEDETRSFVEEELGGKFDVKVDYDKIDVRLSGRAGSFETLAELLRNALVTTTTVDAKTLDTIRARHLAGLDAATQTPVARAADRAAAGRLFGSYPLGRPIEGTPESLARLTRPDLLLARERFLAPDNATLVIVGAIDPARARLVLRQYLGAWRKADSLPQATFRQPTPPKSSVLLIPVPGVEAAELRVALRAPSRTDRDHAATAILAHILRERLSPSENANARTFDVRYDAHKLAGILTIKPVSETADAASQLNTIRAALASLVSKAPSSAEFERARAALLSTATTGNATDHEGIAVSYLDADTYGASAVQDRTARLRAATPADVQRLAKESFDFKNAAVVVAGDKARLETELAKSGMTIELPGAQVTADLAPRRVPGEKREVPASPLVPAGTNPPAKRP